MNIDVALAALGDRLEALGATETDIVIVGGAALIMLGVIERATRDVDLVALGIREADSSTLSLVKSRPLPEPLITAARGVSRDLGLNADWLNDGPADLLDCGLPEGFDERLTTRRYGPKLVAHFASRVDLIFLKVYAAADTGVGRHTQDLRALQATPEELLAGARWALTQDSSEGFKCLLIALLSYFDASSAIEKLTDESQ